jgi:magnesium transporter
MDVVDTYRELCADLRDFYYAVMSQRTNEVMKVLTIVATIFMPLSFIAGVYGMNFDTSYPWNMPELHWPFGYFFSLALMAVTAAGLLWFCARRRWLTLDEVLSDTEEENAAANTR